jgi:hypothetical protein
MGLSRRQFSKEFKLAAVRRLEAGVSLAEVARGLEVNPNVLQVGGASFVRCLATRFPVTGSGAGPKAGWRSWSAKSVSR